MDKLEKALPDSTRQKVAMAQFELGQKIWGRWSDENRQNTERQSRMMGQWNQMNPQFMMQPHIFDYQRLRQHEMQQADAQQQQWWENYWRNWQRPDSATIKRFEERRKRYEENRGSYPYGSYPGFTPGSTNPGSANPGSGSARPFTMPGNNWNQGTFPPNRTR